MKVKCKISIQQFWALLNYLQNNNFDGLTELQILNIRLFITSGLKKLIDLNNLYPYNKSKVKIFSIDINQYTAIMAQLTNDCKNLEPYILCTFVMLQQQNKQLLHLN